MSQAEPQEVHARLGRRWMSFPRVLVLGLFAVEAALLLSERFGWLPFSGHAGWGSLFAVAAVVATLVVLSGCLVVCLPLRWRLQFSIRLLLALTVAAAIALGWLASELQRAKRQEEVVQVIKESGGGVRYHAWVGGVPGNDWWTFFQEPPGPAWMRSLLGDHFLTGVVEAFCYGETITDAELERLAGLPGLQRLDLYDAAVTEAGLWKLRGARPRCVVKEWTKTADLSGDDRITMIHIDKLLESQGIYCEMGGSVTWRVWVPKRSAEAAVRLLREDAKKRRYWICFGEEVIEAAIESAPKAERLPIVEVLRQSEFADNQPLGRFLRSEQMSPHLRAYPFVARFAVRQREYLAAPDRLETGYEVEIELHSAANDRSRGYLGRFNVFAEGEAIDPLGSSQWGLP